MLFNLEQAPGILELTARQTCGYLKNSDLRQSESMRVQLKARELYRFAEIWRHSDLALSIVRREACLYCDTG